MATLNSSEQPCICDVTNTTNLTSDGGVTTGSGQALVYIIVVLLFYSVAIIIAIVSYIRKEKTDADEEKVFNSYYEYKKELCKHRHRYRVQRTINHLERTGHSTGSINLSAESLTSDDEKSDVRDCEEDENSRIYAV